MNTALLIKYISGKCTQEEQLKVSGWLKEDKANELYLDELRQIWNVDPKIEFTPDSKNAWQKVSASLKTEDSPASTTSLYGERPKKKGLNLSLIYKVASILIVVVGVYFVLQYSLVTTEQPAEINKVAMQNYKTEKGQRSTYRLPDESRITLNSASNIRIPTTFADDRREVYLDGEAFFEISADENRPFYVITNNATIKVLGTKFSILAYSNEDKMLVAVEEGKVGVDNSSDSNLRDYEELTRNKVAEIYKDGTSKIYVAENLDEYLGWKDGKLVFKDTPFSEVVNKLERWYNIKITVTDSVISNRKLTASFENEPMTEVLNVVALSLHISYQKDGRTYTFKNSSNKNKNIN